MFTPLKVTFPFRWEKAKASQGNSNCVMVAQLPYGCVAVMDSKNPDHPPLFFSKTEWDTFKSGVIAGEF
jgi:predicted secreted Zn-dependent protease